MPVYPPTSEPISASTPVTASLVAPIAVPTYGPGGTFTVLSKSHIAAPPSAVLRAIRNSATWPLWNTFCPRCVISPSPSQSIPSVSPTRTSADVNDDALATHSKTWLNLGTVAHIDVHMSGDGLTPGRERSRVQGIVITRLEAIHAENVDVGVDWLGERKGKERKGYRIAWRSTGWREWQLRSERVIELVEDGEGGDGKGGDGKGTQYTCWETFGGVLGSVVKATVGTQLQDRFGDYARDLGGFVESGGDAGGGAGEEGKEVERE